MSTSIPLLAEPPTVPALGEDSPEAVEVKWVKLLARTRFPTRLRWAVEGGTSWLVISFRLGRRLKRLWGTGGSKSSPCVRVCESGLAIRIIVHTFLHTLRNAHTNVTETRTRILLPRRKQTAGGRATTIR